jgi:hypothetical protein
MDDLNHHTQQEIDRILAQVDAARSPQPITGEISPAEPAPTRVIDIHVYHLATDEDTTSIPDDTISLPSEPAPSEPQPSPLESSPAQPGARPIRQRAALILLGALSTALLVGIVLLVGYPLLTATASVTIVPLAQQVKLTTTVTVITNGQPTTGTQIPGSQLAPVSMSQERTAPTTGQGHQDAQAAHGTITFYNAAPYAQQIAAGTLLTGADGVQIVTDQSAFIPAAIYPTFGQATVAAHAALVGPAGNIRAGDIYGPCCRMNISAVNTAFHGGQQARDYQSVTQADIDGLTASLKHSLDQSLQAALSTQVAAGQTLITSLTCQQSVTPDHRAGEEAAQVQVRMSETCTGAAYDTQSLERLLRQQSDQQARQQLGGGYALVAAIQSRITQAAPQTHGAILLHVSSTASYAYQFTQAQQQSIRAMIAGKDKAQATTILLHISGVQSVSVSLSAGNQLPTDPNRVTLLLFVTA